MRLYCLVELFFQLVVLVSNSLCLEAFLAGLPSASGFFIQVKPLISVWACMHSLYPVHCLGFGIRAKFFSSFRSMRGCSWFLSYSFGLALVRSLPLLLMKIEWYGRRCKLRREIDAPVAGNWTGVVAGLLPMSRDCPGQLFFGLRGSDRVSGRVVSFYVWDEDAAVPCFPGNLRFSAEDSREQSDCRPGCICSFSFFGVGSPPLTLPH